MRGVGSDVRPTPGQVRAGSAASVTATSTGGSRICPRDLPDLRPCCPQTKCRPGGTLRAWCWSGGCGTAPADGQPMRARIAAAANQSGILKLLKASAGRSSRTSAVPRTARCRGCHGGLAEAGPGRIIGQAQPPQPSGQACRPREKMGVLPAGGPPRRVACGCGPAGGDSRVLDRPAARGGRGPPVRRYSVTIARRMLSLAARRAGRMAVMTPPRAARMTTMTRVR